MMSGTERAAARIAIDVLNAVLAEHGQPTLEQNPHFRSADPIMGVLPNFVLDKDGVAPLRFVFGQTLDIWVGPYSEVVVAEIVPDRIGALRDVVARVLHSHVAVMPGRYWTTLELSESGMDPWRTLRVRHGGRRPSLNRQYLPFI